MVMANPIYIRFTYGREITKYTVIHGGYIRFWPTLHMYARIIWQGNYQIYGHIRCIYTVLANPAYVRFVLAQCSKLQVAVALVALVASHNKNLFLTLLVLLLRYQPEEGLLTTSTTKDACSASQVPA